MKKTALLSCLILFVLLTSCKKKDKQDITVKGHIRYNDANATPVTNAMLSLSIDYDDSGPKHGHTNMLGTTSTDANGYYEISAEAVIPDHTFRKYGLVYIDAGYGFNVNYLTGEKKYTSGIAYLDANIDDGNKVVTTDLVFPAFNAIKFHIKNTSPVNANDVFHSIILNNSYNINLEATGQSVDTTILYYPNSYIDVLHYDVNTKNYMYYSASYLKNGVYQTLPDDSVLLKPLEIVNVDLFY